MNRTLAFTLATSGAIALLAACGGSSSSNTEPIAGSHPRVQPGFVTIPGVSFHAPTPTPTPSTPVYLDHFSTLAGNKVPMGKCLGFDVIANDALGTTFDSTAKVTVSGFDGFVTSFVDAHTLHVGGVDPVDKTTPIPCNFLPLWGALGPVDVTVTTASNEWSLPAAIEMDPQEIHDVGFIGTSEVFGMDKFGSDAGAMVFETPYDVDIYRLRSDEWTRVYPHADFFDIGGRGLVPRIEFWHEDDKRDFLGRGAMGVIFPMNGENLFVVKDIQGKGGVGATYDMRFKDEVLHWIPDGSGCSAAQPMDPGAYHIDDKNLVNATDPAGECLDAFYGTPANGPGPDAMFTITVPAGKELRAAAYDNHWTQLVYLLPRTGDSCNPHPSNCVTTSSYFGGGNTNTIVYDNTTSADQDFYLVFDTVSVTAVKGTSDGAFLVDMQLLDRK